MRFYYEETDENQLFYFSDYLSGEVINPPVKGGGGYSSGYLTVAGHSFGLTVCAVPFDQCLQLTKDFLPPCCLR